MTRHLWLTALVLLVVVSAPARAADDPPRSAPELPASAAPPPATPEQRYSEGHALAKRRDWRGAEAAYRDAIKTKPAYPEAWNGLGYVLRNQGKYDESVRAYGEALRLRPDYPQALEYLGEAYVKMGRLDDARQLLERLRQLKAPEADDLARAISGAPTSSSSGYRW